MIQNKEFLKILKENDVDNCYIFCGVDENLIKENIEKIKNKALNKDFIELNYIQFHGEKVTEDEILNACETLPFMSEKKIVLVYRASFLDERDGKGDSEKVYKFLEKYIDSLPPHCVLILYYVFQSERDKPSFKLKKLDGKATVVKVDKLKGEELRGRVKKIFESKGKDISKSELSIFCNEIQNNMDIIENEVEKLCTYTGEREITKEDIYLLAPQKNENDIFNLVDAISQSNIRSSLDILNELIFRGEHESHILYMIQRQYKLLLDVKLQILKGENKNTISRALRLNPFICEKLIHQCRVFSLEYLEIMLEESLQCEKRMKTVSLDLKTEMEMLIVKGAVVKRNI
ncbi:DNA polymerase III subunit delta [Hathewaya massiliensis]|uniref:DNA polymerase III subunit delta n=1 Tax=Hathewaya massiliensis TaxID=1964382 RepID=UPI00115AEB64|nr:DNA polymerase III subunit delta [Hathewaya massiliensis]